MKPDIRIFRSLRENSRSAATIFVEQSEKAIQERRQFLVALNGGSTPAGTFQLLATEFRDKVDWSHVHVFCGDERCAPASDPESSYGQTWDLPLRHVPLHESNIHSIQGELSPEEAVKDYATVLQKFASRPALVHKSRYRSNPSMEEHELRKQITIGHAEVSHAVECQTTDESLCGLRFQRTSRKLVAKDGFESEHNRFC